MRKIQPLNEGWLYGAVVKEQNDLPTSESWEEVQIPHTWNVASPTECGPRVYKKLIYMEDISELERYYISFGAVAGLCRVWLNGKFLGEHKGGYSLFRFELTESFKQGENVLVVLADNTRFDDTIPLGGDFNNYGGIYRDVELITVPKTHFDLMFYGSPGIEVDTRGDGSLSVKARIAGDASDCRIAYSVWDDKDCVAAGTGTPFEGAELSVKNVHCWNSVADPYLYTLKSELYSNDQCLDAVELPIGFRSCKVDSEKGFYLNGQHTPINGVAKHQDRAGVGIAVTKAMMEEDMLLISETGANAVRLAHYQHPAPTYDWCDKLGIMVWTEIPLLGLTEYDNQLFENAKNQLKELIYQNKHHPSICFWGIQNEVAMFGESIWMYARIEELNALAKELAPSGMTISANVHTVVNDSKLNFITDMTGHNRYNGWYRGEMSDFEVFFDSFHQDNPFVPFGISEYGADAGTDLHAEKPERKDYTEEYQALYHETIWPMIEARPFIWGSFVWNMFDFGSDFRNEAGAKGQNRKGLVTYDRKIRKDAFYFYKACWSKEPFIHLCGHRFQNRCGEYTNIKIYANVNHVDLYVNDSLVGSLEGDRVFMFPNVELQEGNNFVKAVYKDVADEMIITRVQEPDQSYIFVDTDNTAAKDWFKPVHGTETLFSNECYTINDRIELLAQNNKVWSCLENIIPDLIERINECKGNKFTLTHALSSINGKLEEELAKKINNELNTYKKELKE
ncbi:beta-galactosidase [Lachnospiraceae bacterium OttesenSCG-928-D06]|nr:beta-galactosidase [Lachnospiraceae bacterium OttesenSCG-928-D06]